MGQSGRPAIFERSAVLKKISDHEVKRAVAKGTQRIGPHSVHSRFVSWSSSRPGRYPFNINPDSLSADFEVWVCGDEDLWYTLPQKVIKEIYDDPDARVATDRPGHRIVTVDADDNTLDYNSRGERLNLSRYRNARLPTPLAVVREADSISTNILRFNEDAPENADRARRMLAQTTYWVFDPETALFGPSKFCGYEGMTFARYEAAGHGELGGNSFDGTTSRTAIERALGRAYTARAASHARLAAWADDLSPGSLERVDTAKWKFLSLCDWPDEVDVEDEATKAAEESRSRGQGFASSPQVRRAVEMLAMDAATAFFEAEGFVVKDVSGNHPYDLEGVRGDDVLHIEVKGTQTGGEKVFLTKNEVRHARDQAGHVALFVLHSVEVTGDEKAPVASGGVQLSLWPWSICDGELTALSYSYVLPEDGHRG